MKLKYADFGGVQSGYIIALDGRKKYVQFCEIELGSLISILLNDVTPYIPLRFVPTGPENPGKNTKSPS